MVDRYDPTSDTYGHFYGMEACDDGDYVAYDDYAALQDKCAMLEQFEKGWKAKAAMAEDALDALQQENERLKAERDDWKALYAEETGRLNKKVGKFGAFMAGITTEAARKFGLDSYPPETPVAEIVAAHNREIAARAVEQVAELYAFSHGKVWQLQAHADKIRNGEIEI